MSKYKVVYNACFGGFGLSEQAVRLAQSMPNKSEHWDDLVICERYVIGDKDIPRHDETLVKIVELLGEKASWSHADLKVAEIETSSYRIDEYDGNESVETPYSYEWIDIEEEREK